MSALLLPLLLACTLPEPETVGGEFKRLDATPEELPLAWPDALQLLLDDPDKVAGESKWYRDGEL